MAQASQPDVRRYKGVYFRNAKWEYVLRQEGVLQVTRAKTRMTQPEFVLASVMLIEKNWKLCDRITAINWN